VPGWSSGDPTRDAVVIWTRVNHPASAVAVCWVVARDAALTEVVAGGYTIAERERDWTVHVDVSALAAGHTYRYGFEAAGEVSPAQYRRDPDVQAMHAAPPVIATPDDHELADGAWRDAGDVHASMAVEHRAGVGGRGGPRPRRSEARQTTRRG
jgi:phosphodiesterase/alkaline phosphatase D-like protein